MWPFGQKGRTPLAYNLDVLQWSNTSNLNVRQTASQNHEDLKDTLVNDASSYATVKRYVAEFKQGRQSVEDEQRVGRPSTATTEENIDLALDMVMEDRRLSCRQVA